MFTILSMIRQIVFFLNVASLLKNTVAAPLKLFVSSSTIIINYKAKETTFQ